MRNLTARTLLLLALLSIQGLALAHVIQHPAMEAQNHGCHICNHGSLDDAQVVAFATPCMLFEAPRDALLTFESIHKLRRHRHFSIRAPPIFSV